MDKTDVCIILSACAVLVAIIMALFYLTFINGTSASELNTEIEYIHRDTEDINKNIQENTVMLRDINIKLSVIEYRLGILETNMARPLSTAGIGSSETLYNQSGNLTISINYPRNNTRLKSGEIYINGTSSLDGRHDATGRESIYIVTKSLGSYWIYTKATPYYTLDGEWRTPQPCIFTSALKLEQPLEIFAIITDEPYYFGYNSERPLNYATRSESVYVYGEDFEGLTQTQGLDE